MLELEGCSTSNVVNLTNKMRWGAPSDKIEQLRRKYTSREIKLNETAVSLTLVQRRFQEWPFCFSLTYYFQECTVILTTKNSIGLFYLCNFHYFFFWYNILIIHGIYAGYVLVQSAGSETPCGDSVLSCSYSYHWMQGSGEYFLPLQMPKLQR